MAGRRILITGIASYLGTELARRLEQDPDVEYVAGLDTRKPRASLERTEFIEADIRNPVIAKLIAPTRVDTLVHNQIVRRPPAEPQANDAAPRRHDPPHPDRPPPRRGARLAAQGARHQRDRLAPAAGRVREGGHRPRDRDPRLGRHLRRRAGRPAVLQGGHGAALPAALALS